MLLTAGLHWYSATMAEDGLRAFREMCDRANGGDAWVNRAGLLLGPAGASIMPVGRGLHHVALPGDCCDLLNDRLPWLVQHGPPHRATRVDLARDGIDDPMGNPLKPSWLVREIVKAQKQNRHVKSIRCQAQLGRRGSVVFMTDLVFETLYVGSKNSDRRLRVYDERGPTRVELQLRHDWAEFAQELLADGRAVSRVYNGILRNFMHFDGAYARWWDRYTNNEDELKPDRVRPLPELPRAVKSAGRQYGSTLRVALTKALEAAEGDLAAVGAALVAVLLESKLSVNAEKMLKTTPGRFGADDLVALLASLN